MNWRELLKDKRVLAAAAVVGVVGVFALLRKKNGAAAGDEQTEDGSGTAVRGKFDTSATDLSSWLSEHTQRTLDAIRAGQTGGSTTPVQPAPSDNHRVPEPAPPPPPPSVPRVPDRFREPVPGRVSVARMV